MTEEACELPPCVHFSGFPPSRCLAGRSAPRDCPGCTRYRPDELSAMRLTSDERTRCEVWTRVMGYHRPVSAFNAGKRSEHEERRMFAEPGQ